MIRHVRLASGGPSRLLLCALATLLVIVVPTGAAAQTSAEQERDEVRGRQGRLAAELDMLSATDADVEAALSELEAAIVGARADVADAAAAADTATEVAGEARARKQETTRDVARLEDAIREMAIASYIHPPSVDLVESLRARSFSDALIQKAYLDARADRDVTMLGLLEHARDAAALAASDAAVAAVVAAEALAGADAALAALQAEEDDLARFGAQLEDRIHGALAEAAVLADLDAELSARIAREQAELLARLPPPTTTPPTTMPPTTTVPTTTVPARTGRDTGGGGGTDAGDAEQVSDDADTSGTDAAGDASAEDDAPPRRSDRGRTPPPPLDTVQGVTVHAGIAADVDAMLTAAGEAGIALSGSGYRSTDRQIELRRANCGPTDYDIWERPPGQCSPPTAIPGRSLHEQGRAIDMTFRGRLITSRDNDGFRWLAEHAGSYGLSNLPSEPWHWSTTGG